MYNVQKDINTGEIVITESFTSSIPTFTLPGDIYSKTIVDLTDVEKFKSFSYQSSGANETRYLKATYRVSRDLNNWTDWYTLESNITNFPPFDPKDDMYIDIKFERSGPSTIGIISLNSYELKGTVSRNIADGESTLLLNSNNNSIVIKPPYIYKVFSITDLEILSTGDINNLNIKYRYSQDYGRTVTNWEPLTKENITTARINPIRFFQIEYLLEYSGNSNSKVFDINLIGDFQNVTLDGQKTNLYAIRDNCNCLKLGLVDGVSESTEVTSTSSGNSGLLQGSNCVINPIGTLTETDISKLFKPYQQTQAANLLNKLSNDSNQLFGHEVVYFLTDPDKKGIDFSFHEYQLYNYVCDGLIKISVDGNNFPDNQIVMNQFDLSLFESFEVHIPKETFKKAFGVEKRPSKEDFLWFCELNRMFQVEHAQQYRNFNNHALYYKVMLKKYVQKANMLPVNQTIADKVKELTKNSTIDELFGLENTLDKKDISNKEQFRPLTHDVLRVEIKTEIDKELIENSTTILSKSNYDLNSVDYQTDAIVYRNFRTYFQVSDNFSFFLWFNINNYTVNDIYNFVDYYDSINSKGFKINLESDNIIFNLNSDEYRFNIGTSGNADALEENVWYCYLINVDQRQRKLSQWIYKRNVDVESDASKLQSTILRKVYSQEDDLDPQFFELENTNVRILGSDMKMTNIRLFNDVVPVEEHNKILNQYVIGQDYKYLIFCDNANTRLVLPNYPTNQWSFNLIRGEIDKENLDKK